MKASCGVSSTVGDPTEDAELIDSTGIVPNSEDPVAAPAPVAPAHALPVAIMQFSISHKLFEFAATISSHPTCCLVNSGATHCFAALSLVTAAQLPVFGGRSCR